MDGQVYIYRKGDREIILNYIEGFKNLTDEEFMAKVNDFSQKGLFGVHQQGLFFIALWKECKNREMESLLKVEGNLLSIQKETTVKKSMLELLQSKGVKTVKKVGSFLMPVSENLLDRYRSKSKNDSK